MKGAWFGDKNDLRVSDVVFKIDDIQLDILRYYNTTCMTPALNQRPFVLPADDNRKSSGCESVTRVSLTDLLTQMLGALEEAGFQIRQEPAVNTPARVRIVRELPPGGKDNG